MYLGWGWAKAELTPPDTITTARIKVENRVICSLAITEPDWSSVPRQLPPAPMMLFAIRIKHTLDAAVQGPHDAKCGQTSLTPEATTGSRRTGNAAGAGEMVNSGAPQVLRAGSALAPSLISGVLVHSHV